MVENFFVEIKRPTQKKFTKLKAATFKTKQRAEGFVEFLKAPTRIRTEFEISEFKIKRKRRKRRKRK